MMEKKPGSKMSHLRAISSLAEPRRLCFAAMLTCCLLLPSIYLIIFLKPLCFLKFEQSVSFTVQVQKVQNTSAETAMETRSLPLVEEEEEAHLSLPTKANLTQKGGSPLGGKSLVKDTPETSVFCDTSQERYDACVLTGDIRVVSNSSRIIAVAASQPSNVSWKIRPYPRKWEPPLMIRIKELSVSSSASTPDGAAPPCTVTHTTPAVVFSTGGFSGNFFHDTSDILIPLFATSHDFYGEVRFLVADFSSRFVAKYKPLLSRLSRHELINLDDNDDVHCFPEVRAGLINNKELGIDQANPPRGATMQGFRDLLRSSLSLKRKNVARTGKNKPRLLVQLRKGSRELLNSREVIKMARKMGFRVVVAGPEETKNITSYSAIVNSVDALLGVHGAGLTNMVFLPDGAAMVQIVPWGSLMWACRFSYGDPAIGMGLRYFEYEIKKEESSLIEQYPRDHLVFTNPLEIHKQGWNMLWYVFLEKQKLRVDLQRFNETLIEVLRYLKQEKAMPASSKNASFFSVA
ncbi:hypothetical protein HPP92_020140 [Vanilla planifolia]|uniref:Glycosyltransferase 61 catalytic domain-containing protein n=1 Tax=Vanilla planifolia TaxID=51239 RepID=A0A835Q4L6_VANPL|nr:hypothetical protein HPP92_020140 [Vanilla planifolia]